LTRQRERKPLLIDTPEGIQLFHMLAQRAALHLETKGFQHSSRRSLAAFLKQQYGFKGNKFQVLKQLEDKIELGYGPLENRYTERDA
jgi:hypothetical protein